MDTAFVQALRAVVGADGVLTSAQDLEPHVVDWRQRFRGRAQAVVLPRSTAEVAQVVALCGRHRVPVVPQGGNTGQSGGSIPLAGQDDSVIVCLRRMNRVLGIDVDNNAMAVQAGCVLQTLQEQAASVGRFFPLSLGAEGSCQIGGNLATNAGGTAVLRYGNARDLVLGLEVVLADGQVWDGMRALRKDNSGFDLKGLFLGSEGTLGIITGAVLKLFSPPGQQAVAWVAVSSLRQAVGLLSMCRDTLDTRLSAFEYLSRAQVDLVLRHVPGHVDPLPVAAAGYVLVELSDASRGGQITEVLHTVLGRALESSLALDVALASNERQAQAFWRIRHSVSEANRAHGVSLNHDVSVPTSRVAEFVERATAHLQQAHPQAQVIVVSHLGDGNVHFLAIFPREFWAALPDAAAHATAVRQGVYDLAMACGGSFSAEHGVGQMLTGEVTRYKSAAELDLLRRIKHALDPAGLLNPGKVLPR